MPTLDPLASTLTLATAGYAAWYSLVCWLAPYARCRACLGRGRRRGDRFTHRPCRRCHATGRRLRLGRRLANFLRHEHETYRSA